MGYATGSGVPAITSFTEALYQGERGDPASSPPRWTRSPSRARRRSRSRAHRRSTFKNRPGRKAWQLIGGDGGRGLKVGGAQVSELHCNFLINRGGGTAADIEALGENVRRRVKENSGVALEWEIERIGIPAPRD